MDENQKLKTEKLRLKRTIQKMMKKIQATETKEQLFEEKNQKLKETPQRSHGLVETAKDADAIIEIFDSEEEEDPDPPPKKPPTAYVVYTNKLRAKVMEDNPTLSSNDISDKKLGKLWRAVPAAEKEALSANYSKEYYVYRQKMKEWQIRNPERGRLLRSQQWRLIRQQCVSTRDYI